MKVKILGKKILASTLAAMTVVTMVPATALAAAPTVEVDEAVYINLDYYGGVDEVEIVKGCVLNGNTKIVDYGNYTEIVNMTNSIQPVVKGDEVVWDISGTDAETFYFEAKADSIDMTLPWSIDVSYKLNGKAARGEDLAGASGLVSTIITATPNKKAPDYYKNNMVLAVASLADMDSKTYSISAPGAQIQSLGTKKAVFFLALPGEEGTFQIDIGTSEYESMGTFIMMVPATLDSLGMISDVREVKDKVKDSLDLMSDSADIIFDNLINMRSGLEETKKGLEAAKKAKAAADGQRDQVKADVDAAINSLDGITNSLLFLANQTAVEQEDFNQAMRRVEDLRVTIKGMDGYLEEMGEDMDDLEKSVGKLRSKMKDGKPATEEEIEALGAQVQQLVGLVADTSSGTPTRYDTNKLADGFAGKLASAIGHDETKPLMKMAVTKQSGWQDALSTTIPGILENENFKESLGKAQYAYSVAADADNADAVESAIAGTIFKEGAATAKLSGDLIDGSIPALKYSNYLIDDIDSTIDVLRSIITQGDALAYSSTREYKEHMNTLIDLTEEFLLQSQASVIAVQSSMRSIRTLMDVTEASLDVAINSSLNGMIDIIGSAMGITDGTETFRDAKNTMKDAIDNEIDDIEGDSNILNLDINQDFPSFTSDKNASPASIQIVMRTKEITVEDLDAVDNAVDIEPPKEDLGMWGRIKAVFQRIIRFFTGEKEAEQPSAIETQREVYENAKAGNQNKGTDDQTDAGDSIITSIKINK